MANKDYPIKLTISKDLFRLPLENQSGMLLKIFQLECLGYLKRMNNGDAILEGSNPIKPSDLAEILGSPLVSFMHIESAGVYGFDVPESKLNELVPVGWPDSAKPYLLSDDPNGVGDQKTFSEYCQTKNYEGKSMIGLGIKEMYGSNELKPTSHDMHVLFWEFFGIENMVIRAEWIKANQPVIEEGV